MTERGKGHEGALVETEMDALVRSHDWSLTPLGSMEAWSPTLRVMTNLLLANRFPQLLWWGPDYISIYNDAYRPVLGSKHPWALGKPVRECWSEIWDVLQPLIDTPFRGGPSTWIEDFLLEINRTGAIEETHFTVAYSPVPDDTTESGIGGVLATVQEITEKVVGERRVLALRDLGLRTAEGRTAEAACAIVAEILANHPRDVPFHATYLLDSGTLTARLAGTAGLTPDVKLFPAIVDLHAGAQDSGGWPFAEALAGGGDLLVIENLATRFADIPQGPWSDPPRSAAIVPIRGSKPDEYAGFLIAGLSARLRFDELYRSFLNLVATQIAAAIGNARAYEEERRRAEALAALDRAKTNFFSNVSHEFRTPLTLMLNPLEELRSTAAEPERLLADVAHRNALRLLRLVNTLLDFSRIEAGRLSARYAPTDLGTLTEELASTFRSAMDRAGLAFTVETRSLPQPAFVDRDMWEKIVLNLLSNAFKFTLAGTVGVAFGPSADGGHAELVVRDTGTGIPKAELPRLFARFHRVEGAQGRSFEGSGIGLALVQELVSQHGGAVRVESEMGRGSTFTVSIPLGAAHLPGDRIVAGDDAVADAGSRAEGFVQEALRWLSDAEPASSDDGLSAVLPPGATAQVLLADDNSDMRLYVRRLLTAAGLSVTDAPDGTAALAAALAAPPDLVLADVMMPGLDGFGLLAALRAAPQTASVPVILLSARAGESARVEGLQAGADDYVTKPFNARELVARVDANIHLARQRRQTEQVILSQKRILEAIASAAPLDQVLDDIIRFVEVQEPGARSGILVVATDGTHFGDSRGPSLPDAYHASLRNASIEPPYLGSCGETARTCRAIAVADIAADQTYAASWRDMLLAHGLRSVRSTPVLAADGSVIASFAIYYEQARDPLPADPGLIDVATHLAAIAIERHQTEADLREREERLRLIVDSARDYAIITADLDGRITSWNPGAETITGFSSREAVGQTIELIFTREDRDLGIPTEEMRKALSEGRAGNERWHVRRDGSRFFASGTTLPLANGHQRGILTIFRDRTLERELQDELERRNAELARVLETLESRVQERTVELGAANRQLLNQIAEREQAEATLRQMQRLEAVGQLTSGVAHDFNNLLTVILGQLQFVTREVTVEKTLKRLGMMETAAKRGANLTAQLLAFSRRQQLRPKPIDLNEAVRGMTELLRSTMGGTVRLEVVLKPDLWAALVDQTQIELVVLNLAINARDAMPVGGALTIETANVRIGAERKSNDPPPGEYVVVSVTDTGTGIPPEVLEKVFEPFFTTKEVGHGSGLGLAQVYGFAKQSGGGVAIETQLGEGTSVKVFLPRAAAGVATEAPEEGKIRAAAASGRPRVLLVDDDTDVRDVTRQMLEDLGYDVTEAGSAGAALDLLDHDDRFAVLLLDFAMPGMNGAELAMQIETRKPGIPLVFVTGYADIKAMAEIGERPVVLKPFQPDQLAKTLRSAIEGGVPNNVVSMARRADRR